MGCGKITFKPFKLVIFGQSYQHEKHQLIMDTVPPKTKLYEVFLLMKEVLRFAQGGWTKSKVFPEWWFNCDLPW